MTAEKKTTRSRTTSNRSRVRKNPLNEKHIIGFFFLICLLLTVFLGSMLVALKKLHIPDLRTVAHYAPPQATIIYDRNGREVDRLFRQNRTLISLSAMNPLVPKAFVAAEDGRFYQHPGLDLLSVLRAAINDMRQGRRGQGGSTITQQVARGLLLTPEKTYIRKFKEAILAWRIDTLLTKNEILYIYLNQIYLGEGAYGVEAASEVYFGRHASELTLGEVALLAGLPQAPSTYSPMRHPDLAKARQRYVLNRMAADGYITSEDARRAYAAPLGLRKQQSASSAVNGYYLDEVRKRAAELLDEPLMEAGARIYTNLDQRLQSEAVAAVRSGVRAVQARRVVSGGRKSAAPQGALVCLEKGSGRVRALVGGTDFAASPFNRATQAHRPAGSIFKPFVYTAALKSGWQPQSLISDTPLAIPGADGKIWRPKNYSRHFHGEVTLATALAHSYNVATVRLMQKVGVARVQETARAAGIGDNLPDDLSLALGTVDVSLLEITAAYVPFAENGVYRRPSLIRRIECHGRTLPGEGGEHRRVLRPELSLQMRQLLEGVVRSGTGRRAAGLSGITGGKTGTSEDDRDAWFIGFNGGFITGVWVGYDHNQSLGSTESGGHTAAPIWRKFMGRATAH